MKKLLLLLGLFSTGLSYAQTEDPKEEWREIKPYSENVQLFGSLEREKIPFGILSNYSIETTNLRVYDGKHEADSIVMDRDVLSEIYRTLQMGRIHESSAEHFISFEDYSKRWRTYRKNSLNEITDTIPTIYLSGIYYKYARLAENAIEEQKIRFVDNRLLDKYVNNVWQNPYETAATIAVAAPFNVFKSKNIKVALPQDLFLSNEYDLTDITVDFEDGNGFQPFEFGQVIPVSYTQNGSYTWKFRFKNNIGEWLNTRIPIKIDFPIEITPLPSTSQFSNVFINNGNHDAILRIKHIPGNGKTITRPFIVAEGFDPETIFYPEYPQGGISYAQFMNSVDNSNDNTLIDLLFHSNNAEYDIIYIDWVNGVGDIRKNAETLEKIIAWVNTKKQQAGSTNENVLLGQSMGGLVSKYALVKMEQKNMQHQVGLFIAHDSPFRGANVPPSTQFMSRHLLGLYASNPLAVTFGEILVPFIASFQDVDEDNTDLNGLESYVNPLAALTVQDTPAALQMNNYYVAINSQPSKFFHNQWQNEFDALGYPQQSRNVAISNGNMCAVEQDVAAGDFLLNIKHEDNSKAFLKTLLRDFMVGLWGAGSGNLRLAFVSSLPGESKIRYDFEVKTTPETNNNNRHVYRGIIKYDKKHITGIGKHTETVTELDRHISSDYLPLDVFAGGTYNVNSFIGDFKKNIPTNAVVDSIYSFIPVASSLDIRRNNNNPTLYDYRKAYNTTNLNDINLSTGFDNFITEMSESNINNYEHISFSPKNGNWLAQELNARRVTNVNTPNADCSFFCGVQEIYGADIICDKTTVYTYSIPELPAGAEVQWSANGLEILSIENGGSVVKVKAIDPPITNPNNPGLRTLRINVELPGCGEIEITKRIHYGNPTMSGSISGPTQIHVFSNTNFSTPINYRAPDAPGVTHYEWIFPGNFQVVSSFGNPLNIPQNWELLGPGNSQEVIAKSNNTTNGQIKVSACNECGCSNYITLNVTHQHNNNPGWELAPNPTIGDVLNVMRADGAPVLEFPGNRTDVFIYNLQSQRVHQFEITSEGGSTNVAHLAEGIYKVQIDMKNGAFEVLNLQISR